MDTNGEKATFYMVAIIALLAVVIYMREAMIDVAKDLVEHETTEIQEQLEIEIERNRELERSNLELQIANGRLEEMSKQQKAIIQNISNLHRIYLIYAENIDELIIE